MSTALMIPISIYGSGLDYQSDLFAILLLITTLPLFEYLVQLYSNSWDSVLKLYVAANRSLTTGEGEGAFSHGGFKSNRGLDNS